MSVLYTDIDQYCCAWLRNLVAEGLLPRGDVLCIDVREITPEDLAGYAQVHLFAGMGGWPRALQLSGWGDRPVWTASCPCQPFSVAGKSAGHGDERHLWPVVSALARERRPDVIFGEQVARAISMGWWDAVASDLEDASYTVGAAILPACAVGAPHIRNRLWFVAHAVGGRVRDIEQRVPRRRSPGVRDEGQALALDDGAQEPLADADDGRCQGERLAEHSQLESAPRYLADRRRASGRRHGPHVVNTDSSRCEHAGEGDARSWKHGARPAEDRAASGASEQAAADAGGSRLPLAECQTLFGEGRRQEGRAAQQCDWWAAQSSLGGSDDGSASELDRLCADWVSGAWEEGIERVASGIPGRVGQLKALGNAIVPPVAAMFIKSAMEVMSDV